MRKQPPQPFNGSDISTTIIILIATLARVAIAFLLRPQYIVML